MAIPINRKPTRINAAKVIDETRQDRTFLKKEMTKEKLSQFDNKELNKLDHLLQECEDLCLTIKGELADSDLKKAS